MWRAASALVGLMLILITIGIIMLASTSHALALQQYGDAHFFVKRQAVAIAVALVVGFVALRLDYGVWRKLAWGMAAVAAVLLLLAHTPWLGIRAGGANRWVDFGFIRFQPSELAKLATIALMANYLSQGPRLMLDWWRGFVLPLGLLGIMAGLIFIGPDFGTALLVGSVGMALMFAGGARLHYLIITGTAGAVGFAVAVMHNPVRMRRVIAFLDPDAHAETEAFQLLSALYAFVIGGWSGVGLGQSLQKRFYLPESHTDFIFAIIGEELGITASWLIVGLFAALFIIGIRIAWRAPDMFGRLLALGITLMLTLQAALNIAVVTGVVPTKGLPLPFISYGGTSVVISVAMVGILANIALQVPARD